MRQQGARSKTNNPTKDEPASGTRAKKLYLRSNILDKYGRTAGCPGGVGSGQHTEECRARIEQETVDKGDAIKLATSGNQEEIVQEPDVSLKKRKIGEPYINPGRASSLTADTRASIQCRKVRIYWRGCIAAVNKLPCHTPSVDLSRDRTALSGQFPEEKLKAGRKLELRKMLNFDAFELVEELPPGKHAYDMVWVDEWRGDRVRSRLCASVQGRGAQR